MLQTHSVAIALPVPQKGIDHLQLNALDTPSLDGVSPAQKLRMWPIGRAPAFQAVHSGSIPDFRSNSGVSKHPAPTINHGNGGRYVLDPYGSGAAGAPGGDFPHFPRSDTAELDCPGCLGSRTYPGDCSGFRCGDKRAHACVSGYPNILPL